MSVNFDHISFHCQHKFAWRYGVLRAWGFTEQEYVVAFCHVMPKGRAEHVAQQIFDDLRQNPDHNVGGSDSLFGLLSLVSPSSRGRIKEITSWSEEELVLKQADALNSRNFEGE